MVATSSQLQFVVQRNRVVSVIVEKIGAGAGAGAARAHGQGGAEGGESRCRGG